MPPPASANRGEANVGYPADSIDPNDSIDPLGSVDAMDLNSAVDPHFQLDLATRMEIFRVAFDAFEEGLAILDAQSQVVGWNLAAATITGYDAAGRLANELPPGLFQIDTQHQTHLRPGPGDGRLFEVGAAERPVLVNLRHAGGHALPAMLRRMPLRNSLGKRFGTLLRFHPTEEMDALPHGAAGEGAGVERSQADMEDRLDDAWCAWTTQSVPFGLLWVTVDQAAGLRKTHGRDACEAMMAIVERSLLHGLRPTEMLGRWGDNEYLVLAHERSAELLVTQAKHLATLVRNADFRWWGDRVPLTVSVGATQVRDSGLKPGALSSLLAQAQRAMQASLKAGGNHVTSHLD